MLPSDIQLGKVVGGTSSDTLSRGIRFGLKFYAHLALCRLRIADKQGQAGAYCGGGCLASPKRNEC